MTYLIQYSVWCPAISCISGCYDRSKRRQQRTNALDRCRPASLSINGRNLVQSLSKRELFLLGLLTSMAPCDRVIGAEVSVEENDRLFRDPLERYTLSIPMQWKQSEKPGAQVLFKSDQRSSSVLGITINRVKVDSLEEFGTVDQIGKRLLMAEQAKVRFCTHGSQLDLFYVKDGFIGATFLGQQSQTSKTGIPYDIYSYELDTTRGRKRIVTGHTFCQFWLRCRNGGGGGLGVTINDFRLFIVNGACRFDSAEDFERLQRSVASFQLN